MVLSKFNDDIISKYSILKQNISNFNYDNKSWSKKIKHRNFLGYECTVGVSRVFFEQRIAVKQLALHIDTWYTLQGI